MPTNRKTIRHVFAGGWATDFGEAAEVGLSPDGLVRVPFLAEAENVFYEFDGGTHKVGGATKINSSALNSGTEITGIFDYWRDASGGIPTQDLVLNTGTVIMSSDNAGVTFANRKTGLTDDTIPNYAPFDDILIVANDGTAAADVPQKFDGATMSDLGTNTPEFSFSVAHKNRLWAAGVETNGSRLFYGPDLVNNGPDGDWDGSTSGTIDIDPGDGDRIMALISHKNELWVFKGPFKGSIHRIIGSAPTGSDGFARLTFIRGLGCAGPNLVFRFRDDVGFMWSDGTIHSLLATASFGDFFEATLSRPIHDYLDQNINFNRLGYASTVTDTLRQCVFFATPILARNNPNQLLCMDYRFDPVRWSEMPALGQALGTGKSTISAITTMVDTADENRHILIGGSEDGFVRKLNRANRSIDTNTGYTATTRLPFLNYGDPFILKTIYAASVGVKLSAGGDLTFGWQGDNQAQQTQSVTQGGGTLLDDGSNTPGNFEVGSDATDSSVLGGSTFIDRFMSLETGGEFRSVQYEVTNAVANEDLNIGTVSVSLRFGSQSLEN